MFISFQASSEDFDSQTVVSANAHSSDHDLQRDCDPELEQLPPEQVSSANHTPEKTSPVKIAGVISNCPHLASYAAVGLAATVCSRDLPCLLSAATFSRMLTSMSRYSASWDLPPRGPCPGIMIVLSVTIERLSSAARIIPSMLPPVE